MSELMGITYAFSNFADFIAMGKHGLYVWLSYATFLIGILGLFLTAYFKSKRIKQLSAALDVIQKELNLKMEKTD